MKGRILKSLSGFYYVFNKESGLFECRARGVFRHDGTKPLVGDEVMIDITDEENKKGHVTEVLDRKNSLIRPAVSNVDQALIFFAAKRPDPNLNLLDRFLIALKQQGLDAMICFNKCDTVDDEYIKDLMDVYKGTGLLVKAVSIKKNIGLDEIKDFLRGKTTVLAGPSGVGKSSLVNALNPYVNAVTGAVSEKIGRGKQTTRHTEIVAAEHETFIIDTPGFGSLGLFDMEKEDLKNFYPEFKEHEDKCRFLSCVHMAEPECGVKDAVEEGLISRERYENYKLLFEELKKQKKY
ncbi:MAG: ribosome small subunit-dependent GTPase A [Lachnospiraceae bacterium]|nr:ribosome small subunit-dependent GTPase A [Lachnospiraceae bacterium]